MNTRTRTWKTMKVITSYRLGQYKILEDDSGALWWESHTGLGGLAGGRCFIRGDILLLGPSKSEEPGFLKREFLEKLRHLPKWNKTKLYCPNIELFVSRSGARVTEKEMAMWPSIRPTRMEKPLPSRTLIPGAHGHEGSGEKEEASFKLGKYRINRNRIGEVWWKNYTGRNSIRVGKCAIEGDILFMASHTTEETDLKKNKFLQDLLTLPDWKNTAYYCPGCALHECRTDEEPVRAPCGAWLQNFWRRERLRTDGQKRRSGQQGHEVIQKQTPWRPKLDGRWIKKGLAGIAAISLLIGALILDLMAKAFRRSP